MSDWKLHEFDGLNGKQVEISVNGNKNKCMIDSGSMTVHVTQVKVGEHQHSDVTNVDMYRDGQYFGCVMIEGSSMASRIVALLGHHMPVETTVYE